MQSTWALCKVVAKLGVAVAFFSVLMNTAVGGCSAIENPWAVTVRGVVLDSETKKPIPHATVYVDRDPPEAEPPGLHQNAADDNRGQQQITGEDGRFTFSNVDSKSHFFHVAREGYISATPQRGFSPTVQHPFSTYEVNVGQGMGEIRLSLTPAAKIQGRVVSEAGQPMKNALVTLYTGIVEDGRTTWWRRKVLPTDANGFYSFTNLEPGAYAVLTDWIFDNDPDPPHGADCGTMNFTPTGGYPPSANPGVLDFSGAQSIHVAPGHVETANLRLSHREFHAVTWIHNGELSPRSFQTLRDENGRNLRMVSPSQSHCGRSMPEKVAPGRGSPPNNMLIHGVETIHLPDGHYTLLAGSGTATSKDAAKDRTPRLGNFAHVVVAGKPLTLSYPEVPARWGPSVLVHVEVDLGPDGARCGGSASAISGAANDGGPSWHKLWLTRADPLAEYALPISLTRSLDGKPEFYSLEPGKYWVHAVEAGYSSLGAAQTDTYTASVTSGGADMATEPLVVGLDGTAPPLEVIARSHCGIVQLNYGPTNPGQERYGITRSFYGLLVPQFSRFETQHSFLFEPGSPQEITIGNLTPGHYKFYVSSREHVFAFRESNDAAADFGPGQDVWLKPGEKVEVSVAEPPAE